MAFQATIDARQAFKIEVALERARATTAATANLLERIGDTRTAELIRSNLNDLREARDALADAGFGVRETPSAFRTGGGAIPAEVEAALNARREAADA